jgi:hypothetical protein
MINENVSQLLGFEYEPLDDDGSVGLIATPFLFEDGDGVPVYVEESDGKIRFFDDGEVILHFMGRGVPLDEEGDTDFIRELIAPTGASLNKKGEIEAWANASDAPEAFARYLSAVLTMVRWEHEQESLARERRTQAMAAEDAGEAAVS